MTKLKQIATLAFAGSLLFQGCSDSPFDGPTEPSSSATESPESQVTAASGPEIAGSGYTFIAPEGWEGQPGDLLPGFDFDLMVMAPTGADDFAENINVLVVPAEPTQSEGYEAALIQGIEDVGGTDVVIRDPVTVARAEAIHINSQGSQSGMEYHSDQYIFSQADETYIVTFTFRLSLSESKRDETAMSVMSTWSWN